MPNKSVTAALTPMVGAELAEDLVVAFSKVRQDHATKTLERASSGKFVETFVQCLQHMTSGVHDATPKVDHYLKTLVEQEMSLPESLRLIAARIARSIYTVRNKRNIAHKGEVDPNIFDHAFVHHAASWIMCELVRLSSSVPMTEAGRMIARLQAPVGELVEEIEGIRLVHGDLSVKAEVLILLHSHYPEPVGLSTVRETLSRRGPATAANKLRDLCGAKLVHRHANGAYQLTATGFAAAVKEIEGVLEAA
jgi:hypothetical protein